MTEFISHIKHLRRKFKNFDENFDEIETIYGIDTDIKILRKVKSRTRFY